MAFMSGGSSGLQGADRRINLQLASAAGLSSHPAILKAAC
jgi:hypothetical protein